MPRLRILFLALALNPFCPSAIAATPGDKGKIAKFIEWCSHALGNLSRNAPAKDGGATPHASEDAPNPVPIREASPHDSGLAKRMTDFALKRNHPSQLQIFLESLEGTIDGIDRTPVGPDLSVSVGDLEVLRLLRSTTLNKKRDQDSLVSEINTAVASAGKGEKVTPEFVEGLAALKGKIVHIAAKLDALENSHVVFRNNSAPYLAYSPFGREAADIYLAAEKTLAASQISWEEKLAGKVPPALVPHEVEDLERYLGAFCENKVPVHQVDDALQRLNENDRKHGTHLLEKWSQKVQRRIIEDAEAPLGSDRENALIGATKTILRNAIDTGNYRGVAQVINDAYHRGKTTALRRATGGLFYLRDEEAGAYKQLDAILAKIKSEPSIPNADQLAETFYLGFISHCMESAEFADGALSKGMGFHNAVRVSTYAEEAALATEVFAKSGFTGPNLQNVDLSQLATIFRDLRYDSLGHRKFGDGVGPLQAFGIRGANRGKSKGDPYRAITQYLLTQMKSHDRFPSGPVGILNGPKYGIEIPHPSTRGTDDVTAHDLPPTLDEISGFVRSQFPHIGQLSGDELKAVGKAAEFSGDPEWAVKFLASYAGPRDRLQQALDWHLHRLQAGATTPHYTFPVESWLDLPGFEHVRESWSKYKAENWIAVRNPLRLSPTQEAKVDSDSKELIFRNSISADPKPLTVAEEIFHIESLQDAELNKPVLDGWIRELLGEVLLEKELSQVDEKTRYDRNFLAGYKTVLDAIPSTEVQRVLVFLVERDAMLKNLALYKELIKTHPEFKNVVWDQLAASQYPAAKASSLLNQQERFKLNAKLIEKLDKHTLVDVIHALGGQTVGERDAQKAKDSPPSRPAFLSPSQRVDEKFIRDLENADKKEGTNRAIEAGLYEMQRDRTPDNSRGGISHSVADAAERAALPEKPGQSARDPQAIAKFIDVLVACPAFSGFTVNTNSAAHIDWLLSAAQRLAPENRPNPNNVTRMVMGFIQVNGTPGIAGRSTGGTSLNLLSAKGAAKSAAAYFKSIGDEPRAAEWATIAANAEETLQRYLRDVGNR